MLSFCVAGKALGDVYHRIPSFCVAGVALMALGWLRWRAWTGLVAGDAAALCVAGVALGDICLPFARQARHLVTSISFCVAGVALHGLGWQLSAFGAVFCKHVKKTIFHARHVSGSLHDLSPHALAAGMKENLTLN